MADYRNNPAVVTKYTIDRNDNNRITQSRGWERVPLSPEEIKNVLPETFMLVEQRHRADKRTKNDAPDCWAPGRLGSLSVSTMHENTKEMIIAANNDEHKPVVFVDYFRDPHQASNSWFTENLPINLDSNVRKELRVSISDKYDFFDYVAIVLTKKQEWSPWTSKLHWVYTHDPSQNLVYTDVTRRNSKLPRKRRWYSQELVRQKQRDPPSDTRMRDYTLGFYTERPPEADEPWNPHLD